jgi:DNA-binding response OmpR family regulator
MNLHLTRCEHRILSALTAAPHRAVPHTEILSRWPGRSPTAGSLKVAAHRLRTKLAPTGLYLETERRVGMRLVRGI